jgi:hypothetical protein
LHYRPYQRPNLIFAQPQRDRHFRFLAHARQQCFLTRPLQRTASLFSPSSFCSPSRLGVPPSYRRLIANVTSSTRRARMSEWLRNRPSETHINQ